MIQRVNDADVEQRVQELLVIRLDGAQFHDCVAYAKSKNWQVSDRTVRRYVRRADNRLVRAIEGDRRRLLARHMAQRESLFARSVSAADYRTGLAVLADLAKLQGLYPRDGIGTDGSAATLDLSPFRCDPLAYARFILKITPTPDQERIARSVLESPYRVLVKSGHNIGKTFLAAWLVNWWYDTRNPGIAVTTAPTQRDVVDLLWTEVRLQRARAGLPTDFIGPAAPHMRTGEDHYAKGYTASKGESFQGRHRENMLFVFDEAEGVDTAYWKTADTMFQPDGTNAFLTILNPTTTTSQSYFEERAVGPDGNPKWTVITASALDHPNVIAGLANRSLVASGLPTLPIPVPAAVTLEQAEGWIADWFEPVPPDERDPDVDIEWPPGSGRWLRPDPDGEARVLGRRPSAGAFGVWNEKLWLRVCAHPLNWNPNADVPEIGCDVAAFGVDRTEMHVRCGPCSLAHEDHGGWDSVQVAERLMAMADAWSQWINGQRDPAAPAIDPRKIKIKVDDTGVGFGVSSILRSHSYNVVPVNAGSAASDPKRYPRLRDELWFVVRDLAKAGKLDLTRLPAKRKGAIQIQALAPTWQPTPDRRRQVEPKDKTKERLGKSPDGMDALNLAYHEPKNRTAILIEKR